MHIAQHIALSAKSLLVQLDAPHAPGTSLTGLFFSLFKSFLALGLLDFRARIKFSMLPTVYSLCPSWISTDPSATGRK